MIDTEDRAMARSTPTHADLERAIESVPGVAEAHVTKVQETGKSRLRIRLSNDEDAESVSWSIAATLRERFGISLDPDQIRPRVVSTPLTDGEPAADVSEAVDGTTGDAQVVGLEVAEDGGEDATEDAAAAEDTVLVTGDRVLLSEAARDLLEAAVAEAREAEFDEDADAAGSGDAPMPEGVVGAIARSVETADTADAVAHVMTGATADDLADTAAESAESAAAGADPKPAADVRALADAPRSRRDETRARIRHLDTRVHISDVEVTATLAFGAREVTGSARAIATEQGVLRAVAEATLRALSELTGERLVAGVDSVAASVSGEPSIATVIVSMVTDRGDEALLGSSLVRKDPQRAVMRATLDALNRRVEPWLEVEIAS